MLFEVFQGYLADKFKAVLAIKTQKLNYRTPAPPSGLARSSRDHGRDICDICANETFTRAILKRFNDIFMRFQTSLMP